MSEPVGLTDGEREALTKGMFASYLPSSVFDAVERILADRLAAERRAQASLLCSQCGEQMSSMVKVGTNDGWCAACLDEAAEPTKRAAHKALRERVEEAIAPADPPQGTRDTLASPDGAFVVMRIRAALAAAVASEETAS